MRGGKAAAATDNIQTQLDNLQSKYRMMEVNKKNFKGKDKTNAIESMQRRQIDKLKKDNERLKEDLSLGMVLFLLLFLSLAPVVAFALGAQSKYAVVSDDNDM